MTRGTTQRETEDKQIVRERIGVRDSDKGLGRERQLQRTSKGRERDRGKGQ